MNAVTQTVLAVTVKLQMTPQQMYTHETDWNVDLTQERHLIANHFIQKRKEK